MRLLLSQTERQQFPQSVSPEEYVHRMEAYAWVHDPSCAKDGLERVRGEKGVILSGLSDLSVRSKLHREPRRCPVWSTTCTG